MRQHVQLQGLMSERGQLAPEDNALALPKPSHKLTFGEMAAANIIVQPLSGGMPSPYCQA